MTENKLLFVWKLLKNPIRGNIARFANVGLDYYIGKKSELNDHFIEDDEFEYDFCTPDTIVILLKANRIDDTTDLDNRKWLLNAFKDAKEKKANMDAYLEWLIYEYNVSTKRIVCSECSAINKCDIDGNFTYSCSGCFARHDQQNNTFHFTEHYLKSLKQICRSGTDGDSCGFNACCKVGHKAHFFINLSKDDLNYAEKRWSNFVYKPHNQCINCGLIDTVMRMDSDEGFISEEDREKIIFNLTMKYCSEKDYMANYQMSIDHVEAKDVEIRDIHTTIMKYLNPNTPRMFFHQCVDRLKTKPDGLTLHANIRSARRKYTDPTVLDRKIRFHIWDYSDKLLKQFKQYYW